MLPAFSKDWNDSSFSTHTTAMEAMNLCSKKRGKNFSDKVCLITGANSGIGKEAAVALASGGATVIAVCRDMDKAAAAAEEIIQRSKADPGKVIPEVIDCGSLQIIKAFCERFQNGEIEPNKTLNILINNAGIMQLPNYTESVDGFEMQFAVNFLAGYYLVESLLPFLRASSSPEEPSRVVNVSSAAHLVFSMSRLKIDSLPVRKSNYKSFQEYSMSKMFQILHSMQLNERYAEDKANPVISFALHPGVIQTALGRSAATCSTTWWLYAFPNIALTLGLHKTLQAGAGPTVRLALDPELRTVAPNDAIYFNDNCNPGRTHLPKDPSAAGKALMEKSEKLVQSAIPNFKSS